MLFLFVLVCVFCVVCLPSKARIDTSEVQIDGRIWKAKVGGHHCGIFDGSEIRRSPVEVGSLSHFFARFSTSQVVSPGFLNHQQ